MKPSQYIKNLFRQELNPFPVQNYTTSCLIYKKRFYGIFYVTGKDNIMYTVKVNIGDVFANSYETAINLYLKRFASHIPNLLIVEDIYLGDTPLDYSVFTQKDKLDSTFCKSADLEEIFQRQKHLKYVYTVSETCLYNLGYYLGSHGGRLDYSTFVAYTFELFVALQTLHRLGVWHRDLKPANVLVCQKDISVAYVYEDMVWTTSYKNGYLKLIDFGESQVVDDVSAPCQAFQYEVNVGLVNIIKIMWNKTEGDKDIIMYEDLVLRMQNCQTSVLDLMLNSPIFDRLKGGKGDIRVDLLN